MADILLASATSLVGSEALKLLLDDERVGKVVARLDFASLMIARPGFLGGRRIEHRPLEQTIARLLRITGPALPAQARINPASIVAAMLVEAAIVGDAGRHVIGSATIARGRG